jgi:Cu-Zn family superoxide dismutase
MAMRMGRVAVCGLAAGIWAAAAAAQYGMGTSVQPGSDISNAHAAGSAATQAQNAQQASLQQMQANQQIDRARLQQLAKEITVKIKNSAGEDAGKATFTAVKNGVKVKLQLKNLPFGDHGVHIHQKPVCDAPDFKGAGPHFNPDGKKHGFDNPMGHHNGDFPKSVSIGEDHKGEATFLLDSISLSIDAGVANSLYANGGTAIVVHEKADDETTDPSGNSGNRIACGVIGNVVAK